MRFTRFSPAVALAALALVTAAAQAAPVTYQIDLNHSQVGFTIRHIFSKVSGKFDKFEGSIDYDAAKPENSKVEVTIQANSIDTNNERRDKDLRSTTFFAVDSIPTLTFSSTKVSAGKDGALTIEGNLSMHGVTRAVVLKGAILGADANVAGFEATTTINRKDYNITWNKQLDSGSMLLSDDVTIQLNVEAHKPRPMPPAGDKAPEKKS